MHQYRSVGPADLELICRHRYEMFKASGRADEDLAPMGAAFEPWLRPRLLDGRYFGWIAESGGRPVGGLGMMVVDWPPHPSHPRQDRRGYVLNVFVEPDQRGRGVAHGLLDLAVAEARRRGVEYMFLHATAMGRPIYERRGWRATSEMAILVKDA